MKSFSWLLGAAVLVPTVLGCGSGTTSPTGDGSETVTAQFGNLTATSTMVQGGTIEGTLYDTENHAIAKLSWNEATRVGSWEVGEAEGPFTNLEPTPSLEGANTQLFGIWQTHTAYEAGNASTAIPQGCQTYIDGSNGQPFTCCSSGGNYCCCSNCGCGCGKGGAIFPQCQVGGQK
jgi:hypothetical protein